MTAALPCPLTGTAVVGGRTFDAWSDDGITWSVHELCRDGVEWLLVPRPGHDQHLIILAEWTDAGGGRFEHRVLDAASVDWSTADDVAEALGDYALLTHAPLHHGSTRPQASRRTP